MSKKASNEQEKKDQRAKKTAFYERLKEELDKNNDWPTTYMYKFIVPNEEANVEKIAARFADKPKDLKKNYSKTGKYVSITVVTEENNPDAVINRYKSMEDIDGLVAL